MPKVALVTGITGQDGSYLTELLLAKGYVVHGIVRRSSSFNTGRIDHLYRDPHEQSRLHLHFADMSDATGIRKVLEETIPDEIYNLAAQSHVRVSFDQPVFTGDVTGLGVLRLLEAVRDYHKICPFVRLYQAGSSEMFGSTPPPHSIDSPFRPRSPYASAKVFAHWNVVNYREGYGLFACNGILHNHESPRRGETFVTRKITRAVGRIRLGLQDKLFLGNLEAKRDWGHARDYVEAMWLMLQQDVPSDYVVATGKMHSVREFADAAFCEAGLDWERHVEVDPRYFRPTEVDALCGNATRTQELLGWQPKTTFEQLVQEMVDHDLELARREKILRDAGHDVGERRWD